MIHGVYFRTVGIKNALWKLATVSTSAEVVLKDQKTLIDEAKAKGESIEAKIKSFDSIWNTPETLLELEENSKLLYN